MAYRGYWHERWQTQARIASELRTQNDELRAKLAEAELELANLKADRAIERAHVLIETHHERGEICGTCLARSVMGGICVSEKSTRFGDVVDHVDRCEHYERREL
jgi:hypothetical protein